MNWPVHVISLPRSTARREWMAGHLRAVGLEFAFADAVDGRTLADEPEAALSRGDRACYLSHVATWRRVAAAAEPGAVILEDDAQMLPWFSAGGLRAVAAATRSGEVVLLQSTAHDFWWRHRRRLRGHAGIVGYTVDDTMLASAYCLTRAGAAALVERWEREGIRFPVDHWYWTDPARPSWAGTLPVLALQPNAFVQRDGFTSEIEGLGRAGPTGTTFCRPREIVFDGRPRHWLRDAVRWLRRRGRDWGRRPAVVSPAA